MTIEIPGTGGVVTTVVFGAMCPAGVGGTEVVRVALEETVETHSECNT